MAALDQPAEGPSVDVIIALDITTTENNHQGEVLQLAFCLLDLQSLETDVEVKVQLKTLSFVCVHWLASHRSARYRQRLPVAGSRQADRRQHLRGDHEAHRHLRGDGGWCRGDPGRREAGVGSP